MEDHQLIYLIRKNTDQTEGRGYMIVTGVAFTNKQDAEKYLDKTDRDWRLGWMDYIEVDLYNDYTKMAEHERQKEIEQALSKLTEKEKILLGLQS